MLYFVSANKICAKEALFCVRGQSRARTVVGQAGLGGLAIPQSIRTTRLVRTVYSQTSGHREKVEENPVGVPAGTRDVMTSLGRC